MSKIDYQKLREIAEKTKIAGEAPVMPFDQRINALNDFMKHFSPDIALALLDEVKRLEDTNIDAMCRIAELESNRATLAAEHGIQIAINELLALAPRLDKRAVDAL
nr:ead/Ea22-like family protein [Escherichia coli]